MGTDCAAGRDARPEGLLLAVLAVGAGYATGRIMGSLIPVGAGAGGALVGVFLALFGPSSSRVLPGAIEFAGPDGRSGVTAALLTLAVGAACCAAWATPVRTMRVALRLLAAATTASILLVGTPVGFAAALGVLLCSLAAGRIRRRLVPLAALGLAAAAVTGVTVAVAQDALPRKVTVALEARTDGAPGGAVAGRAAPRRVSTCCWARGPDTFRELSPTNRETALSDGKPHSAPLQIAAEQGLPGLLLLCAAYAWLMLTLWASPGGRPWC